MFEVLAYAIGAMYSPGPVNLLCLNVGLGGHSQHGWRFCLGVGTAMGLLFLVFGFTGEQLVSPRYQMAIAVLGCGYILWLAYKVAGANTLARTSVNGVSLNYASGLAMQLLNPKAFVAVLPLVTVLFPANHITGTTIIIWAVIMGLLAAGAPASYLLLGSRLGRYINSQKFLRYLNLLMAMMLVYVALDIFYNHVYLMIGRA